MKFITDKQFLEQPKEIQDVFMKWWKPQIGDLYMWEYYDNNFKQIRFVRPNSTNMLNGTWARDMGIPLLTMGQLIDFIEERTNCKLDFNHNYEYDDELENYDFWLYSKENQTDDCLHFLEVEGGLLDALWTISIKIALIKE